MIYFLHRMLKLNGLARRLLDEFARVKRREVGQGFSVVTDLDQHIIETIQSNIIQATNAMDSSEKEVKEGMTRIVAVGDVFEQMIDSVQEVV
ncbi:hypothetical protein [Pueribacillus sp. YX66]|uniref:hypothetical protein n=1 Tax=Pueribacillus sp. YX66 TaxID=3229242 RepID=UPI00358D1827